MTGHRPPPALLRVVDTAADLVRVVALAGLGWSLVRGSWADVAVFAVVLVVVLLPRLVELPRRLVAGLHADGLPWASVVVVTAAVGTTLAVWWEFYEWIVYNGAGPPEVGYDDTVLDLLMGTLSAGVAGVGLAVWSAAGWGTRRLDARPRGPLPGLRA